MAAFRIQLFGQLAISIEKQLLYLGIPATKPLELLAYLLIHRQRVHPREHLATLLWPDLPNAQAKRNLRKVLCTLQHLLNPGDHPEAAPLFQIEHDWVAVNPAAALDLDIAAFEHAYTLAQQHSGEALDPAIEHLIGAAVDRYSGELLAGLYDDWCLHERERLENMYLELLHILQVHATQQQAYDQAIDRGLAILQHDHANERAYADLMRLYYLNGNRTAALHLYRRCVAALSEELDVQPSRQTEQLYQQICTDSLAEPPTRSATMTNPAPAQPPQAATPHLLQMQAELQRLLDQVHDELQRVKELS
jgi:DNA-binding SARP family transcriptional activator